MRNIILINLLLLLFVTSCTKDETLSEIQQELVGVWYLKGFGNDLDATFVNVDTDNSHNTHVLSFRGNKYVGSGFKNPLAGDYEIDDNHIILNPYFKRVLIEPEIVGKETDTDKEKWHSQLFYIFGASRFKFKIENRTNLNLYYTDNDYLLYGKLENY